jgi:hypothetical protein
MKRTFILLSIMIALLMPFAVTKVGADCTDPLPPGGYFESRGYRVEIQRDADCNFPKIVGGNSVFEYKITKIDPKVKDLVNWVDILIPSTCTPNLNPTSYGCTPLNCYGKMFTGGSGDPFSGFGLGLTAQNTWKWDWTLLSKLKGVVNGTVSLTLPSTVYASKGNMFLKSGLLDFRYPFGEILAPACGLVPAQVFPPQVPATSTKTESMPFNGVEVSVCIESNDSSGCPTSVFSCPGNTSCDCSTDSRILWTKEPFSDVKVDPMHLKQLWMDFDPRCPTVFITTESATCTRRCNSYTGSCYVGPPGCNPGTSGASPMLSTIIEPPPYSYGELEPVTTSKQENVNNVVICSEQGEGKCPDLYSCCGNESCTSILPTCDCGESGYKQYWTDVNPKDFAITQGHLKWVGASGDLNCPTIDIVTESSTCVKRCNPFTGYCSKGPPGCT